MTITLLIIAVTCVVSFMAFSDRKLLDRLILWPPAITRGKEWWRLASCGLIHADVMHLAFNMITLFFFGRAMEGFYVARGGEVGYLVFYVGALVVSSLPSYLQHKNDSHYRSLGASGAVSAVLFAFILLAPWSKIIVLVLPMPAILYAVLYVVYSIYMDRQRSDNINHSAHLWGAAYGVFATILIEPGVVSHFLRQLGQPSLGFG
ncbi:rhomboid family intramembrane serine protease [Dokdonella sp.]|uniref:rhomboid family intramembrane serine protease n=1 Tax=Dokdonella sp. TaxID=2291710 RepID=UPI002609995B|nr:rhomboid family intramembrane serine protease [Dokdonella sp.]